MSLCFQWFSYNSYYQAVKTIVSVDSMKSDDRRINYGFKWMYNCLSGILPISQEKVEEAILETTNKMKLLKFQF